MAIITRADGSVQTMKFDDFSVPFREKEGTGFRVCFENKVRDIPLAEKRGGYEGNCEGVFFRLFYKEDTKKKCIRAVIENRTDKDFSPEYVALRLGIDTYMESYPQWNTQPFPTLLRCEKTHFYGYFMTPLGKILGLACANPIASYHLDYNMDGPCNFGHRIYTAELHLLHSGYLPDRYPKDLGTLRPGEKLEREIILFKVDTLKDLPKKCAAFASAPILTAPRYTVAKGEKISVCVSSPHPYTVCVTHPDGTRSEGTCVTAKEYGEYLFTVTDENGKTATLRAQCHRPWSFYLSGAREAAFRYPQKATTHAESYYGFYSAFLAAKHMPDKQLDEKLLAHFRQVMPYMFDFKNGKPKLIPGRIQNTSTAIGILVDLYESSPETQKDALRKAGRLGDFLLTQQGEDGAYRRNGNNGTHYTCVIYIAKSMLELALAEKQAGGRFRLAAKRHYASAGRAVDELVRNLENIGTEGEHTFEDGMISCSALQIGMFALTLPKSRRAPYIRAAEHMLTRHRCLEGVLSPDYRSNGGSMRFWEAQYDVMLMANFMNSPHGWTAWTVYACFYLYLLTGKREYIERTYNALGACASLLQPDGTLYWAYAVDPYIRGKHILPDSKKPVKDAYHNLPKTPAYRAKWEDVTLGECYVPMISDWYRTGKNQKVTGGYHTCGLIYDDRVENVDNQGGACDNDVHEIFKCLEETLYGRVFLNEEKGSVAVYGAPAAYTADGVLSLEVGEDTKEIHCALKHPLKILFNGKEKELKQGLYFMKGKEYNEKI